MTDSAAHVTDGRYRLTPVATDHHVAHGGLRSAARNPTGRYGLQSANDDYLSVFKSRMRYVETRERLMMRGEEDEERVIYARGSRHGPCRRAGGGGGSLLEVPELHDLHSFDRVWKDGVPRLHRKLRFLRVYLRRPAS